MQDRFERTIDYLRLSVTNACSFRCSYCMPDTRPAPSALSLEELTEIGEAAVACGIRKLRITGGEPLMREDILMLCERLAALPGLRELALTTNGAKLPEYAEALKAAGVQRLNISIDSLREDRFQRITRCGSLSRVLAGIHAAEAAGFAGIKLNVVLMGGVNEDEIPDFVHLTETKPFSVRFIELMPIGACAAWPEERFLAAEAVLKAVPALEPAGTEGVSELYRLPGAAGTVGLIRPMSHCFCPGCSRLRVTADGMLKPCLHSAEEYSLRGLHGDALREVFLRAAAAKPLKHSMTRNHPSESLRCMGEIGG